MHPKNGQVPIFWVLLLSCFSPLVQGGAGACRITRFRFVLGTGASGCVGMGWFRAAMLLTGGGCVGC